MRGGGFMLLGALTCVVVAAVVDPVCRHMMGEGQARLSLRGGKRPNGAWGLGVGPCGVVPSARPGRIITEGRSPSCPLRPGPSARVAGLPSALCSLQ